MSLCERPDELGLRGGVDGSRRSRDVETGSSWRSSPLKSPSIPFNAVSHPVSSPELGKGVTEDTAVMTLFRSTSLTLMLRRLFLEAVIVAVLEES